MPLFVQEELYLTILKNFVLFAIVKRLNTQYIRQQTIGIKCKTAQRRTKGSLRNYLAWSLNGSWRHLVLRGGCVRVARGGGVVRHLHRQPDHGGQGGVAAAQQPHTPANLPPEADQSSQFSQGICEGSRCTETLTAVLGDACTHHHHQPRNVPTAGAQAFPMDGIGRLSHDPPRRPSADWRVLTTADAAGTNFLTCLSKHGGTRDRNFWSPIQ
ncbi:hypothetical protein evm_014238 [Chilo suppressalis]|nr:hypothetical protein evm_014238 [Chilo suppressalis]